MSAQEQSLYADYINSLTFLTDRQYSQLQEMDSSLLSALKEENYEKAVNMSQTVLEMLVRQVMNLSNLYDFTYDGNYLTNSEYVCYLQKPEVRKAIHAGNAQFGHGYDVYRALKGAIMKSKKLWLSEALERGIEVLIYNGNLDVIVNLPGKKPRFKSQNVLYTDNDRPKIQI